jgi:hypothetical protein
LSPLLDNDVLKQNGISLPRCAHSCELKLAWLEKDVRKQLTNTKNMVAFLKILAYRPERKLQNGGEG